MKKTMLFAVVLLACSSTIQTDEWFKHSRVEQWDNRTEITVSNSHGVELENVPVIIDIDDLKIQNENLSPGNFYVYNHQTKITPLYQVDLSEKTDLKEIVFLTSLEPGQQKTYHIYYTENGQAWPQQDRYTQATDMPGWESELFGYRSYGPLTLDLFARNNGNYGLMLHHFYDSENRQIFNYHAEHEFGLDILHIGSTAGLAGVGLYGEGEITFARAPFDSEVIVSGPVRSIIRMQIKSWESEFGTVSITREATVYAHHYETQIEDRVSGVKREAMYAVGIRKEKESNVSFNKGQGRFLQWHNQGDDIGDAGLGIYMEPKYIEQVVENDANHFLLAQPPVREPLRFWAFGAWDRGEDIDNLGDFSQRAERIEQLQLPIQVKIGNKQIPSAAKN